MWAVVPGDLERVAALDRGPGVVGDDRDAADGWNFIGYDGVGNLDDLDNARHLLRIRGVEGGDLAADHRRARDDGVLLPGQADVLAIMARPVVMSKPSTMLVPSLPM